MKHKQIKHGVERWNFEVVDPDVDAVLCEAYLTQSAGFSCPLSILEENGFGVSDFEDLELAATELYLDDSLDEWETDALVLRRAGER